MDELKELDESEKCLPYDSLVALVRERVAKFHPTKLYIANEQFYKVAGFMIERQNYNLAELTGKETWMRECEAHFRAKVKIGVFKTVKKSWGRDFSLFTQREYMLQIINSLDDQLGHACPDQNKKDLVIALYRLFAEKREAKLLPPTKKRFCPENSNESTSIILKSLRRKNSSATEKSEPTIPVGLNYVESESNPPLENFPVPQMLGPLSLDVSESSIVTESFATYPAKAFYPSQEPPILSPILKTPVQTLYSSSEPPTLSPIHISPTEKFHPFPGPPIVSEPPIHTGPPILPVLQQTNDPSTGKLIPSDSSVTALDASILSWPSTISSQQPTPLPLHISTEPEIVTLEPTFSEFRDFNNYIKKLENDPKIYSRGIVKVIPPKEFMDVCDPAKIGIISNRKRLQCPREQTFKQVKDGVYKMTQFGHQRMGIKQYKNLSNETETESLSEAQLEKEFWGKILSRSTVYGSDKAGSLMPVTLEFWNMNKLGSILDEYNIQIPGVTSPYLYYGLFGTSFCWHSEDQDLYSMNYLHFGKPKSWYVIPPDSAHKFEELCKKVFRQDFLYCKAALRHKVFMMTPDWIKNKGIPVYKTTQYAGQFIITFPRAYHAGYNHGYNCAEAVNFGSEKWIVAGKNAKLCECTDKHPVNLDMTVFDKKPINKKVK